MHDPALAQKRILVLALATFFLLVVAVFLRVAHLGLESVDGDELFSRRVAAADMATSWNMARQDLVHPPLYYFVLKTTIPPHDGSSVTDIRRLSLVCGALTIVVVILIGVAAPELRAATLLAALLLSLNEVHIFYSQQARSYAFYTTLVAMLLLWRALARRYGLSLWFWMAGTLLMIAITWTHYVGALFCAACALSMYFDPLERAASRSKRMLPLLSLAVTALLFLPWLMGEISIYRQKTGLSRNLDWEGTPGVYDLKALFARYIGIPELAGATTVVLLLGVFLVCCAFLRQAEPERNADRGLRNTLAMMALGPPVLLWLLSRKPLQLPIFGDRHLLPAIVPFLILMCYGWMRLAQRTRTPVARRTVLVLGTILLCALQLGPVVRSWPGPVRQPYATIARDLEQTAPQLPVYTTWDYGIGEPVRFYLHDEASRIHELPATSRTDSLPARVIVLYRPQVGREAKRVQPWMRKYNVVAQHDYSGVDANYKTELLVLNKRDEVEHVQIDVAHAP